MRHRASARPLGRDGHSRAGARLTAVVSVALMLASAAALVSALTDRSPRAADGGVRPAPVAALASPRAAPGPSNAPAGPPTPETAVPEAQHWRDVLARLDRRRAAAYASADPGLLRRVYVPGTAVLRRDERLLARYARHGMRVRGLRMDVADLRVRARSGTAVVLRVRERVAAGTVTGHGSRRALPADDLDSRLLRLARVDRGMWLVAAVRPARR